MEDDQSYLLIPPTNRQYSSAHLCQGLLSTKLKKKKKIFFLIEHSKILN